MLYRQIRKQFPNIFKRHKLSKEEQALVEQDYKEHYLPYQEGENGLSMIMNPFYSTYTKKSVRLAWKR